MFSSGKISKFQFNRYAVSAAVMALALLAPLSCWKEKAETIILPLVNKVNSDSSIRVMTRNLYLGSDLTAIMLEPDPNNIPGIVATVYDTFMANKYSERAEAIADEIASTKPHLIGLQEATLWRTQSPGYAVVAGTVPATDVLYDHLEVLQAALKARGLNYKVAAKVENFDVELPRLTSPTPTFDDLRLTDYTVILARSDVKFSNVVSQNFATNLTFPTAVGNIDVLRGYMTLDATVGGETFKFANTHLESFDQATREAQATELIGILATETKPVIFLGDFNSIYDSATPGQAYVDIVAAGYTDIWKNYKTNYVDFPGLTCCFSEDLSISTPTLSQRIDYIMLLPNNRIFDASISSVGDKDSDRTTTSGLWPSDHAGLVAEIKFW